jgi:hypothetical protein
LGAPVRTAVSGVRGFPEQTGDSLFILRGQGFLGQTRSLIDSSFVYPHHADQ